MVKHGDLSMYQILKCRCSACRQANRDASRVSRENAKKHPERMPEHAHGTVNGYNYWCCRCKSCLDAHSRDREMRRPKRGGTL